MLRFPETLTVACCGLLLCLSGCRSEAPSAPDSASQQVSIAVTSYPLLAMVQRMVGSSAEVELVVQGETRSPDWKPTSDAVQTMQQATRILISGGGHEPWLQRVTVPRSRVIDTADGYYARFIRIPDAVVHQHGPDGSHSHPGVVWATWLDPQLALSQLEKTRDILVEVLPDDVAEIRKAADGMADEFRQLDTRLEQLAASTADSGITVLGDAPLYQYLAQRLGWKLTYVHLPRQGPLSDSDRSSLISALEKHQPSMVWIQSTLAEDLPALQGDSAVPFVLIDLCERPHDDRTLGERLGQNLDHIQAAL